MVNNIFFKFFSAAFIVLISFSWIIYLTITPLITEKLTLIEENTGKNTLKHIIKMIDNYSSDVKNIRTLYIDSKKENIKALTEIQNSYIKTIYDDIQKGYISEEKGKKKALEEIRKFRYGKDGYFFVSNTEYRTLSHPYDELHGSDKQIIDVYGKDIVSDIVNNAMKNGSGFTKYWWVKEGEQTPSEKLTYSKLFEPWNWIIGTGIYLDEVEKIVQKKKEHTMAELRDLIHKTKIGKTGYLYIFNADGKMIIHPNSNVEHKDISKMLNPVTNKPLYKDLMNSVRENLEYGVLNYKWDTLQDPGNHIYEKVAWVKFVPDFNWYIASSVYTDEFKQSSNILKNKIISDTALISLIVFLFIFSGIRTITNPIKKLSLLIEKVNKGDLNVRSEITRDDEIGTLAKGFDNMIVTIKEHIDELDSKVKKRTTELEGKNEQLEQTIEELETTQRALIKASITDELTKTYNRKKIHEELDLNIEKAQKENTLFSIIFFDIDKFKNINDNYGHLVGDKVLIDISSLAKDLIGKEDILGRFGGEEFIIISSHRDLQGAIQLAQLVRESIEKHHFKDGLRVTSSFGVSEYIHAESADDLIKRADDCLYQAKSNGRNQVVYQ